jgi:hypothetical protein
MESVLDFDATARTVGSTAVGDAPIHYTVHISDLWI